MNYCELKEYVLGNEIDELLSKIKGTKDLKKEKERYLELIEKAYKRFGDGDYHLISSPGRTEIGGNHTDHQHGHTLSATINYDNICVVKACEEGVCTFIDEKFDDCVVDLSNLEVVSEEKNTSKSLIRGIAARFNELGYRIGGFKAMCDSGVAIGSGMSSSACFEVMVCEIFNCLYNNGVVTPIDRAIIGQYAENKYFGKASGLLDQATISVGGFVAMDFKDPSAPVVENYKFNFEDYGYELILVNTKGDHADLSDEYSAVPSEMKDVAKVLNADVLVEGDCEYFFNHIKDIREKVKNDRSILRAIHFYTEDKRAILEKQAVEKKDIKELLYLINKSGRSSYMYLQNVYPSSQPKIQPLSIGLAVTDLLLGDNGAFRVHGGGFGGTIQAIVPSNMVNDYKQALSEVFDNDSILELVTRPFGTKTLI